MDSATTLPSSATAAAPAAAPASPALAAPASPASGTDQLVDLLILGGPVVWILLAMSVAVIAIVLVKVWQHRAMSQVGTSDKALDLWRRGQQAQALELVRASRSPLPATLYLAMEGVRQDHAPELMREEAARVASGHLEQMRHHLKALEVIAALAPLLGLFGTVLGMIAAFQQMQGAGSQVDPSVLSGGIWVALLTTAVGLAVAIPTVMVHAWLERNVDRARHRFEDGLTQVFTHPVAAPESAPRLVPVNKLHAPA